MTDKLEEYRKVREAMPDTNRLWPLYGAGFENLGREGQPINTDIPAYGPDELLVRHDAVGICFSDIKVINAGEQHPDFPGYQQGAGGPGPRGIPDRGRRG